MARFRIPAQARKAGLAALAALGLLSGLIAIAVGPAAPILVDSLADGRKIWRLGRLELTGVSGPHLGALRAQSATLRDERGVWARARGVEARWRPTALLRGVARIESVEIESIEILRRPELTAPGPGGGAVDAFVERLVVERIGLEAGVIGEDAAAFALEGGLAFVDERIQRLAFDLARTDGGGDRLTVAYGAAPLALDGSLSGPEGGVFAELIGGPVAAEVALVDQAFVARADVDGTRALDARLGWTDTSWSLSGRARIDAAPALESLAARIGPALSFEGSGGRPKASEQVFTARAEAERLSLSVGGRLAPGLAFAGPLEIDLQAPASLIGQTAGTLRFVGALETREKATRLNGVASVAELSAAGAVFDASAELEARITAERVLVEADFQGDAAGDGQLGRLLRDLEGGLDLEYLRRSGDFRLRQARLEGPALSASAKGGARGEGFAVSGDWRINELSTLAAGLRGYVGGAFALTQDEEGAPTELSLDGRARGLRGGSEALRDLVGSSADFFARLIFEPSGVSVPEAELSARRLRLGAQGRVIDGAADLRLEASARGPVTLGAIELTGVANATGRITGPIGDPTIAAEARLAALDVLGVAVENARAEIALRPENGRRVGRLTAEGSVAGRLSLATGIVRIADGVTALEALDAQIAELALQGSVAVTALGPSADLSLSGRIDGLAPEIVGAVSGAAELTPQRRGPAVLAVNLDAQDLRFAASPVRIQSARLAGAGPLDAIAFDFGVEGLIRPGAPFALNGAAQGGLVEGASLTLTASGTAAGAAIATLRPARFSLGEDGLFVEAAARIAGGEVEGLLRRDGARVEAGGTLRDFPLSFLGALSGEAATGTLAGTATLRSATNGGLAGEARITLDDAQLIDRSAELIDATIEAELDPGRFWADLAARSSAGLTARGVLSVPVTTSAADLRIARAAGADAALDWNLAGPVGGLWAIVGPLDQRLTGDVDGAGELRFGDAGVSGNGELAFDSGRFEDRITGLSLEAIEARVTVDPQGLVLQRLSASDGQGGRLAGAGRIDGPGNGEIRIQLSNLRLLDRPDAQARGGGSLTFAWTESGGRFSGDIALNEAEATLPEARAAIPTLDVIEINKPGVEGQTEEEGPTAPAGPPAPPVQLDVRVRAPERVFTRGRGLDAEWSLDLRLVGTLEAPRIQGAARLIRGSFNLASRQFTLERGLITFDGDPLSAELDIVAERDTPDLTARVLITGTPEDPQVAPESTPDLPEDEILPQVLFGRNASELSTVEAAQLAAGLATLAGRSAFDIAGIARSIVDLDRLDVRQAEGGGLLITGGRYLTRDVYLEVSRGPLGQATTSIEWQVRPRLFLISSFLPEGDQRVAIRWRRDY